LRGQGPFDGEKAVRGRSEKRGEKTIKRPGLVKLPLGSRCVFRDEQYLIGRLLQTQRFVAFGWPARVGQWMLFTLLCVYYRSIRERITISPNVHFPFADVSGVLYTVCSVCSPFTTLVSVLYYDCCCYYTVSHGSSPFHRSYIQNSLVSQPPYRCEGFPPDTPSFFQATQLHGSLSDIQYVRYPVGG
jgi:hypothetical protein